MYDKKFTALIWAFILALLVGCAGLKDLATGAAKEALGAGDKGGIELDAQIGDRENEVQLGGKAVTGKIEAKGKAKVEVKSEQTEAKVEKAETVNISNVPWWVFLVALMGWILPTPQDMVRTAWAALPFNKKKRR